MVQILRRILHNSILLLSMDRAQLRRILRGLVQKFAERLVLPSSARPNPSTGDRQTVLEPSSPLRKIPISKYAATHYVRKRNNNAT